MDPLVNELKENLVQQLPVRVDAPINAKCSCHELLLEFYAQASKALWVKARTQEDIFLTPNKIIDSL